MAQPHRTATAARHSAARCRRRGGCAPFARRERMSRHSAARTAAAGPPAQARPTSRRPSTPSRAACRTWTRPRAAARPAASWGRRQRGRRPRRQPRWLPRARARRRRRARRPCWSGRATRWRARAGWPSRPSGRRRGRVRAARSCASPRSKYARCVRRARAFASGGGGGGWWVSRAAGTVASGPEQRAEPHRAACTS